jgi:hypothetical protein
MTRLVTIDADHPGVQFFIKEWAPVCSGLSDRTTAATAVYIRDQIAAQTRIPEPIEALAEVTAHTQLNTERRKFVRGYHLPRRRPQRHPRPRHQQPPTRPAPQDSRHVT